MSTALYECVRPEKLRLKSRVLSAVDLFGDGKLAMARVNQALLKETGAVMSDAEGIVAELRSLKGVEIAAFLKEGSVRQSPGQGICGCTENRRILRRRRPCESGRLHASRCEAERSV